MCRYFINALNVPIFYKCNKCADILHSQQWKLIAPTIREPGWKNYTDQTSERLAFLSVMGANGGPPQTTQTLTVHRFEGFQRVYQSDPHYTEKTYTLGQRMQFFPVEFESKTSNH